jgi:hypothetical protein
MIKLKNLIEATHKSREVETLPGIFVDREIAKHIKILNLLGFHTSFSCSGISDDHPYDIPGSGSRVGYVMFKDDLGSDKVKEIYNATLDLKGVKYESVRLGNVPYVSFRGTDGERLKGWNRFVKNLMDAQGKLKDKKISESFFKSFKNFIGAKEYYVEVFKNPTTREISYCTKDNSEIAALLTEKDIYVWDRDKAIHSTAINQLGGVVSKCLPILIQMKDDPHVDVYITHVALPSATYDNDSNRMKRFVINHPFFKRRKVESISAWSDEIKEKFNEVKEPNKRLGRCYELAGRYVSVHPKSILVHGKITNPFAKGLPEVEHAWIEIGNEIFDPVMDLTWPKNVYEDFFKAKIYKKYTYKETMQITDKTGNWGPWES